MLTPQPSDTTDDTVRHRDVQEGLWKLRLLTEVRTDGVYIRLVPLHQSFRQVRFEELETAEVTGYSPAQFGGWGWGIRMSPTGTNTAYRLTSGEGVLLTRTDGSRVFVGANDPEALVEAIEAGRRSQHG